MSIFSAIPNVAEYIANKITGTNGLVHNFFRAGRNFLGLPMGLLALIANLPGAFADRLAAQTLFEYKNSTNGDIIVGELTTPKMSERVGDFIRSILSCGFNSSRLVPSSNVVTFFQCSDRDRPFGGTTRYDTLVFDEATFRSLPTTVIECILDKKPGFCQDDSGISNEILIGLAIAAGASCVVCALVFCCRSDRLWACFSRTPVSRDTMATPPHDDLQSASGVCAV